MKALVYNTNFPLPRVRDAVGDYTPVSFEVDEWNSTNTEMVFSEIAGVLVPLTTHTLMYTHYVYWDDMVRVNRPESKSFTNGEWKGWEGFDIPF